VGHGSCLCWVRTVWIVGLDLFRQLFEVWCVQLHQLLQHILMEKRGNRKPQAGCTAIAVGEAWPLAEDTGELRSHAKPR
jgi:hypothetical protein